MKKSKEERQEIRKSKPGLKRKAKNYEKGKKSREERKMRKRR